MKIAAVQMVSTPDVGRNLEAAGRLLRQAKAEGAALAVLPEYFCFMGRRDTDKLAIAERDGAGPIQDFLAREAKDLGLWLIGGTLPIVDGAPAGPGARARNANCVYAPDGTRAARYDKVHLFNYDNGRERYDEAATLQPGTAPAALQCGPLRVGLSVCYDLRFPELYRALMNPPLDLISVPAAFTHTTGRAHWELLLRARAVENQCYVVAAAQGGTHENGRRTWGQSMVVDPWGEVVAQQAEGEGVVLGEVDLQRMADVRMQLPAIRHRRLHETPLPRAGAGQG